METRRNEAIRIKGKLKRIETKQATLQKTEQNEAEYQVQGLEDLAIANLALPWS